MTRIIMIGFLIGLGSLAIRSQIHSLGCQQIKPQLITLSKRGGGEDEALSKLFQIGDQCIDELISALSGTDPQVAVAAQEAIRYLGNEKGLKALDAWNKNSNKSYPVWGPVPIPITELDYEMIEVTFLGNDHKDLGLLSSRYLYALAIDKDSPKSKSLFQTMLKRFESISEKSVTKRMAERLKNNYPLKRFSGTKSIENAVLENAFFLSKEEKKYTTAKLLNYNGKKRKALIELRLSRGILAEEWHHVVVRKMGNSWEFFSITFVKQS